MKQDLEIVSLNADDLDIEELERRLELALGSPVSPDFCFIDICFSDCGVNCDDLCGARCSLAPCGAANCSSLCTTRVEP
ncbi:MAG: hypothetical protein GFH27_549287n354 [Chloroflexi bacterium AL-W]|nr:hypothetical protein [Chloroflexi bacterium AL-N1]NOK66628.1 hypothetical protein [Chloroflexi bacterium AL-N10]NOK72016.1 hypothetical protein [Chloroflexi bacterium AL-N5]NOK81273.1 hypothetical protein [Chloroflexi bacterium AL-W]NOK89546.1 hypothetical protein [Chloroflexi bacterium AL-N15]